MKFYIKHIALFFLLSFAIASLKSQCVAGVQITAVPSGSICKGDAITFTANTSNGGPNPTFYWILNGDTVSTDSTYTGSFSADNQIGVIMYSSLACNPDSAIDIYAIDVVEITASPLEKTVECFQTTTDFEIENTSGGLAPYTYNLDGADQGSNSAFSSLSIGSHTLIITDANGCKDTLIITINPVTCELPIAMEAVTPNEDGFNDYWYVFKIERYPDNEVYIFDRYGQRVYHKKGYKNAEAFDFKYLGVDLPVTTYFYVIELGVEDENGDPIILKGPISVFR